MLSSVSIVGGVVRFGEQQHWNWQEDPTFNMKDFLDAYPDQLAVIQPLLDRGDPTSPVLENALEALIDARSEAEARHVISQIAESQRRLESAFGNTAGALTGMGLAVAIDALLLASLGGGLVSLGRARSASRLNLA
jgi:hypothetical protein